jgi:hypothetical protein
MCNNQIVITKSLNTQDVTNLYHIYLNMKNIAYIIET